MDAPTFCYFDNNATTPVAPQVLEAMLPFFTDKWGNPSSAYFFGHQLTRQLDHARASVASLIGAEPREMVFTSCGTESNNSALQCGFLAHPGKKHIITTSVEHSATLKFCGHLERLGCSITRLPVSPDGSLDLDLLDASIRPDTALVSIIWANNETGVIFPIKEAAAICRSKGVWFHTDAVQAAGKLAIDVRDTEVDFLSLSAHKIHAPKGIGALFVRNQVKFQPYIIGGGQERGRRGGTENVPYIVGFGRAAELALEDLPGHSARILRLRDRLEAGMLASIAGTALNGKPDHRLPNTSNLSFEAVEAEGILMLLDQEGICASSGSACTTGSLEPSHVLTAMGRTPAQARSSIRFSLGRQTAIEEVDRLLQVMPGIIQRLREG